MKSVLRVGRFVIGLLDTAGTFCGGNAGIGVFGIFANCCLDVKFGDIDGVVMEIGKEDRAVVDVKYSSLICPVSISNTWATEIRWKGNNFRASISRTSITDAKLKVFFKELLVEFCNIR